jgi:hypothetical protein
MIDHRATEKIVYLAIAGKVANRKSVLTGNFMLGGRKIMKMLFYLLLIVFFQAHVKNQKSYIPK